MAYVEELVHGLGEQGSRERPDNRVGVYEHLAKARLETSRDERRGVYDQPADQQHQPDAADHPALHHRGEVVIMRLLDVGSHAALEPHLGRCGALPKRTLLPEQLDALVQDLAALGDARAAAPEPVADDRVRAAMRLLLNRLQ